MNVFQEFQHLTLVRVECVHVSSNTCNVFEGGGIRDSVAIEVVVCILVSECFLHELLRGGGANNKV